jgi:hypothetical protein
VWGHGKHCRRTGWVSDVDFKKLATLFDTSPKVAAERMREGAEEKVKKMVEANPTRVQLVERLEKLVADYNTGSIDAERFFEELKTFVQGLDQEEQRAAREGLTEEELAIFDLLTTPEPKLTKAEEQEVKRAARELLEKLHGLVDAVDWVRGQETRGAVWTAIRVGMGKAGEQLFIEQSVSHPAVEALDERVLGGLARCRVMPLNSSPAAPGQHRVRSELGAVIADDHPWLAAHGDQIGEFAHHSFARDRCVRDRRQKLTGYIINDVKHPEPAARHHLVMDKV